MRGQGLKTLPLFLKSLYNKHVTIHRFFVDPSDIKRDRVFFNPEQSKQITKVIRLKKGDSVIVLDNEANEFLVELDQMISDNVSGKIIKQSVNMSEPVTKITLYQAITPRDKFENILQKGTEIGICAFVPIETKRSLLKVKDLREEKIERFRRIVAEASEQSERGIIPQIIPPLKFEDAIKQAVNNGLVLLAWENENLNGLTQVIKEDLPKAISIFIGPEGGFEESEIEFARSLGVKTQTLGPRVLRTETAGPLMAGLLLLGCGDLDRKRSGI